MVSSIVNNYFYLTHRWDPEIGLKQVLSQQISVDLGVMTIKGYPTFPNRNWCFLRKYRLRNEGRKPAIISNYRLGRTIVRKQNGKHPLHTHTHTQHTYTHIYTYIFYIKIKRKNLLLWSHKFISGLWWSSSDVKRKTLFGHSYIASGENRKYIYTHTYIHIYIYIYIKSQKYW